MQPTPEMTRDSNAVMSPITIRPLEPDDLALIAKTDGGPAWNAAPPLWQQYLADMAGGERDVLTAFDGGDLVGYGSLVWRSDYPPFAAEQIPEINNLVVADRARNRGIASRLIGHFEQLAVAKGRHLVGIGVGLYADYGAAQRLYAKLGYQPDGRGITYAGKHAIPDQTVSVDDDLILWLTKSI